MRDNMMSTLCLENKESGQEENNKNGCRGFKKTKLMQIWKPSLYKKQEMYSKADQI